MVVDLQGIGYNLCDPEIATKEYFANENETSVLFCAGNCASDAIDMFLSMHKCNEWCEKVLKQ